MSVGGAGGRFGQALYYAGVGSEDSADERARKRVELITRWLPEIVDDVLAEAEIARGIENAGLDRYTVRQQTLDARQDVITPTTGHLDRAVDTALAAGRAHQDGPERWTGVGMVLFGVAVFGLALSLTIDFWPEMAWWTATLAVVACFGAAGFGGLAVVVGWEAFRGTTPRATTAGAALARWRQSCREDGVLPFVRRVVNAHVSPDARTSLAVTTEEAPGLHGDSESSYVVRTSSVLAFLAAANRLPTGAIGLAGPRGVGKTSLIEHFAGRADDRSHGPVRVTVAAPVRYEPRDFVLHLFATVCAAVLLARGLGRFPLVRRSLRLVVLALGLVVATVAASGFDVFSEPARVVREADLVLLPAGVLALLLVLDALAMAWAAMLRRKHDRSGVLGLARTHLENIHYLQTHTTGWSGKVTLPKSEVGWSRSRQRERRPQTYPELVAALCDFLAAFAETETTSPALVIAVDELDKIDSADLAQQFVNEIKSVFAAPGTQFLVSVSEDALASFERRGLPVRDAFDSAFHEIVRVDYLSIDDTGQLLSSRVIGLPEPFGWLVHCLSGGLPRDVVRTARAMVALTEQGQAPPSLDEVCAALVRDDLGRKSHAFQLACRDIGDSPEVTEFIRSLRQLSGDAEKLLGLVPALLHGGELAPLSRQAAAYVYYSATLLAVFTRDRVDTRDAATFDGLARAKQSLAVHPRLAWLLVDEFREAWGLATVPAD